jgi:DNA repair exonuclease SbcCD ATPase subunit
MISDQVLIEAIDKSPLSQEDKQHWKDLLSKLSDQQRDQLHHSLLAKTEIRRAITLIEKALEIISEAEEEAEEEVKKEDKSKTEKQELLKELKEIKAKEDEIIMDEETLKKKQEETNQQIIEIRDNLKQLSLDVHGQPPPSYNKDQQPPSIPQLKK